jgi:hypothetical protein
MMVDAKDAMADTAAATTDHSNVSSIAATAILPFHFLGNQLEDGKQTAPPHLGVGFFWGRELGVSEDGVSTSMDCGRRPYPRLSSSVAAQIRADAGSPLSFMMVASVVMALYFLARCGASIRCPRIDRGD